MEPKLFTTDLKGKHWWHYEKSVHEKGSGQTATWRWDKKMNHEKTSCKASISIPILLQHNLHWNPSEINTYHINRFHHGR